MSLIDEISPETVFFDVLVPLKQANLRRGISYFALGPDTQRQTYWEAVATRTSGMTRVPAARPEADLLNGLATHWSEHGETLLMRALPALRQLQRMILDARSTQSEAPQAVSHFIYPLF